jgi:hypothetical protein
MTIWADLKSRRFSKSSIVKAMIRKILTILFISLILFAISIPFIHSILKFIITKEYLSIFSLKCSKIIMD